MSFEITGKLIEKYDEVQVSDKFKKREFVIEQNDKGFVDQIKFQIVQDKTELIEPFAVGDQIKIAFNIRGNKWKDNYFVNLQAWKLEKLQSGAGASQTDAPPPPTEADLAVEPDSPDDDLPF